MPRRGRPGCPPASHPRGAADRRYRAAAGAPRARRGEAPRTEGGAPAARGPRSRRRRRSTALCAAAAALRPRPRPRPRHRHRGAGRGRCQPRRAAPQRPGPAAGRPRRAPRTGHRAPGTGGLRWGETGRCCAAPPRCSRESRSFPQLSGGDARARSPKGASEKAAPGCSPQLPAAVSCPLRSESRAALSGCPEVPGRTGANTY